MVKELEVQPMELLVLALSPALAGGPSVTKTEESKMTEQTKPEVKPETLPKQPAIKQAPMEPRVVKTGEFKPELKDGYLYITVEGSTPEDLAGLDAKKLAWGERFLHGFGNAGIEVYRTAFPKPMPKPREGEERPVTTYLITYRLTPGL